MMEIRFRMKDFGFGLMQNNSGASFGFLGFLR